MAQPKLVACPKCSTVTTLAQNTGYRAIVHCPLCDINYAALKKYDHEADRLNRNRKKK